MKPEEVIEEATRLSESDRIRLAERILATLDGVPDDDASELWAREIERRSSEIELGAVRPIPWSEVRAAAVRKARDRR